MSQGLGMRNAPISLSGLLKAKSPLVTLNKIHAFFLSVTSIDAINNTVNVPVMVVADSLDELRKLSKEKCHLNEFILLSGLKANRIALDGGKKWQVALFKCGKGGGIKQIDESEVHPLSSSLLDCCFERENEDWDWLAYEGTITRLLDDFNVIFDEDVLIIGAGGLTLGQQVKLFNLAKAPLDHSYVQSLTSLLDIKIDNIFVYLPWFSSLIIDTYEKIDSNPVVYPSFCFRSQKTLLRDYLTAIGFPRDATKVANWLWRSYSIGFMFLQMASGNSDGLSYFDDFKISEIGKLAPQKVECENLSRSCRYSTVKLRKEGLIIGKIYNCPVSGFSLISDITGSVLIHTEEAYPNGGLVCIKGFDHISETFLIDPLVMSTISRAYIRPSLINCFSSLEELCLAAERTYYLVTISSVSPPSLTQIKPLKLQGSLCGNCICVVKLDGDQLNIKGSEKQVTMELSPKFWWNSGPHLQVGSCLIAFKSPQGGFIPEFPVDIETDSRLLKGAGKFLANTRTLLVSREVHNHILRKSAPFSIPQDIQSILSSSTFDSSFVHFRGTLVSVELLVSDDNRGSPVFQRLFASHSIGLPIDGAKLRLKVVDSNEPTYEISVDYTPSVLPVGLEKGTLIEGTNFVYKSGILSSHSNSYIRVKSLPSFPESAEFKRESTVPFHYLADFYGHHMKHPNIPIMIHSSIESIENLKIIAQCRKCGSAISQMCCPIHGKIASDEVDLSAVLNFIVNDGTFNAHAVISGLGIVLQILGCLVKLDQVTTFTSAAGAIDHTSPLFVNCTEHLRFRRFRIKAVVTEAIQKITKPAQFVRRNIKVGRSIHQAYSYPGKISLKVVEAWPMDDKQVARRYLDLLEL